MPRLAAGLLAAVLLAWVLVADPIVEIAGLAPLAVVCVLRIARDLARGTLGWYEPALAAAAGAAAVMAWSAGRLLRALGGYVLNPVPFQLRTLPEWRGSVRGIQQVLELFGADVAGLHGIAAVIAVLHPVSVVPAGAVVLGGYLAGLGYGITRPCQPPQDSALASWLAAHHLRYGLASYWQSSSVTVDSGGRVAVRAADTATLRPYLWMSDQAWYNPALHQASFLILAWHKHVPAKIEVL
jgi:hypothetical protein